MQQNQHPPVCGNFVVYSLNNIFHGAVFLVKLSSLFSRWRNFSRYLEPEGSIPLSIGPCISWIHSLTSCPFCLRPFDIIVPSMFGSPKCFSCLVLFNRKFYIHCNLSHSF